MQSVVINEDQKQYSIGSMTGQVVYATNGWAIGSINVYDQKGQVVRSVRKGLNGFLEDVRTAYTFTGDIDSTEARINVGYGSDFIAKTYYTYQYGKKTKMKLSVCHSQYSQSRETEYNYDAIGRLTEKRRQLTGTSMSDCSYSYDVHGWLTNINSGGFLEQLYYADGLSDQYYNGNISTIKWKAKDDVSIQGYNLKYDRTNRLKSAVFGSGNNLTGHSNYFDESAEYDCNGNITRLKRCGLTDNMHGGFGLVDDLYMAYKGNMLTSVRDEASRYSYAGATDFDGVKGQEYPLTYNDEGSLVSDAGRKIARIDYDYLNNPIRIQFTNGNVTKYVYSATGEKLRVIYQTAVPNITVSIGSSKELASSEIQYADSTDYLLGGALTLKNGRIDKFQFEEGYCQAEKYNATQDNFTFCYYDQDHLGNIRQVTKADGSTKGKIIQKMHYYPFGAQLCDGTTDSNVQSHRYNGKEYDRMHGLNTYDYGARQYNPVTARWDRVDPLCEKYYNVSPYAYCANNPVNAIDPDGKEIVIVGSHEQRLDLLASLQKLTNNEVAIKRNGQVYIRSYGTRNIAQQLTIGTELVNSLIAHKRKVTVQNTIKNSRTHPISRDNTTNGKGTDANIYLNTNKTIKVLVRDRDTGESTYETSPSHITLGHELVHGLHHMNGTAKKYEDKSIYSFKDVNGQTWKTRARTEELETTGIINRLKITENKLREEHKLNERIQY